MDKFKAVSIALVVVSIICIALVANAGVVANQLNQERQKSAQLKAQASSLEAKLKAAQDSTVNIQNELNSLSGRLDQETRISQDLRNALANEQATSQNLRTEIDRLNSALSAAQPAVPASQSTATQ